MIVTQARVLIGSAIALLFVLALAIGWFQWRAAKDARARAVVAEQGQVLAEETTGIVERTLRTEVTIHTQAERQANVVQAAPGAEAPLDPEFRARLCAAVASLRDGAESCNDQPAAVAP